MLRWLLRDNVWRTDMKHIRVKDEIQTSNTGTHNIATLIIDSLSDRWGESGLLESLNDEVGGLKQIVGRLVNILAQKDLMSPEEVYLLVKGYTGDETVDFVEEN